MSPVNLAVNPNLSVVTHARGLSVVFGLGLRMALEEGRKEIPAVSCNNARKVMLHGTHVALEWRRQQASWRRLVLGGRGDVRHTEPAGQQAGTTLYVARIATE